jgi:hypothetical protein
MYVFSPEHQDGRMCLFDVNFPWLFGLGLRYRDIEDAVFQGSLDSISVDVCGELEGAIEGAE